MSKSMTQKRQGKCQIASPATFILCIFIEFYGSGSSNVLTTALPSLLMKNHCSALYFMP